MTNSAYRSFIDCNDYGRLYGLNYLPGLQLKISGCLCGSRAIKKSIIIKDSKFMAPVFRLDKYGQRFINPRELEIDLTGLKTGEYRVAAVHNFQAEDNNPNLDECLTGIFIAGLRPNGKWEEPENYPFECRTIEILGYFSIPLSGKNLKNVGTL
jgi:hypothetical protein